MQSYTTEEDLLLQHQEVMLAMAGTQPPKGLSEAISPLLKGEAELSFGLDEARGKVWSLFSLQEALELTSESERGLQAWMLLAAAHEAEWVRIGVECLGGQVGNQVEFPLPTEGWVEEVETIFEEQMPLLRLVGRTFVHGQVALRGGWCGEETWLSVRFRRNFYGSEEGQAVRAQVSKLFRMVGLGEEFLAYMRHWFTRLTHEGVQDVDVEVTLSPDELMSRVAVTHRGCTTESMVAMVADLYPEGVEAVRECLKGIRGVDLEEEPVEGIRVVYDAEDGVSASLIWSVGREDVILF